MMGGNSRLKGNMLRLKKKKKKSVLLIIPRPQYRMIHCCLRNLQRQLLHANHG